MIVFTVSGTFGSGKGTFIELIKRRFSCVCVSTSDSLRNELKKHGIPVTRENMQSYADKLTSEKGLGILAELALEGVDHPYLLLIDGVRRVPEINFVKQKYSNVHSIWIDADIGLRYERIISRAREGQEKLSFEQFKISEEKEMIGNNSQKLIECKKACDLFLENNGSPEEFEVKSISLINQILSCELS